MISWWLILYFVFLLHCAAFPFFQAYMYRQVYVWVRPWQVAGHTWKLCHAPVADQPRRGSYLRVWLRSHQRWVVVWDSTLVFLVSQVLWVYTCCSWVSWRLPLLFPPRRSVENEKAASMGYADTRERRTWSTDFRSRKHDTGVRGAHRVLLVFIFTSP